MKPFRGFTPEESAAYDEFVEATFDSGETSREPARPPATGGSTACPWCSNPLERGRIRAWWYALCEDDECGFAAKAATTFGLLRYIAARRR